MTLHLHDSASRREIPLDPVTPGKVGIYLCGATVQGAPHVGHLRSGIAFDVLVRWLRRSGLDVTLVRNVTDIDDKILTRSAEAGAPWWAWAYRYEREFTAAYAALGVLPPTYEPRATGHVTEMVALMRRLEERGHAYAGDPGNVYFSVRSFEDYGALTNQRAGSSAVDETDLAPDKRDPLDFALWKAPRPGEPASAAWDTPYGRGRPGWHLECSAMAHRYLGEDFDIHGGGIDLRFPHHENEQAQSRAAGYGFARIWMHNAWVVVAGEKMGKSLGNALTVDAVLGRAAAPVVRLALASVHYRGAVEFSDVSLAEAATQWERITSFVLRSADATGEATDDELAAPDALPAAFTAAMDDDLGVSAAMAVVHAELRAANTALAEGRSADAHTGQVRVRAMLDVLGLDPLAEPWRAGTTGAGGAAGGGAAHDALAALVEGALEDRAQARADKDWARADAVRDRLTSAGISVEDGAGGARWHLAGGA
ncbi:cysteine--tRNA ligase [Georgenia sp. Z1491]|uniref:cysteine--tRNA ligase n=1 Tax=Georgenia sp. Z1491 TaxID=3416707 RepID=UPI003CFA6C7F